LHNPDTTAVINLKVRKGSAPPVKLRQQLIGDINELD
jgi:hypothetical protein